MSTNIGVITLFEQQVVDGAFKNDSRFIIEDNIGEGIHIHYKNMRYDFSVSDFLKLSDSCKKCLAEMGYSVTETNGEVVIGNL